MIRNILIILLAIMSVLSFAETYEVSNTIGKVYAKTPEGKWKKLKEGSTITEENVIKIEENSSIGFMTGTKKTTIRGPKENTVEALMNRRNTSAGAIKKVKINKGSVAKSTTKTSKGTSVAATRATEAEDTTNWEEE